MIVFPRNPAKLKKVSAVIIMYVQNFKLDTVTTIFILHMFKKMFVPAFYFFQRFAINGFIHFNQSAAVSLTPTFLFFYLLGFKRFLPAQITVCPDTSPLSYLYELVEAQDFIPFKHGV